ncbi:hypothetical protein [Amycolatopsis sp. NPDC059657]|uniref:hypothetical protein n=1 Tax=Amycolatopsis sp. NPDC059657 TaxID=3346899 RepID=UPI00366E1B58
MRSFKRLFTPLATILLSAGMLLGLVAAPANAAAVSRHFILISTHGAPSWSARAELYHADGTGTVYTWRQKRRIGGRALWYFNANDKYSLLVSLHGVTSYPGGEDVYKTALPADRDYCFRVDAVGNPYYTGDSRTGGCNSN